MTCTTRGWFHPSTQTWQDLLTWNTLTQSSPRKLCRSPLAALLTLWPAALGPQVHSWDFPMHQTMMPSWIAREASVKHAKTTGISPCPNNYGEWSWKTMENTPTTLTPSGEKSWVRKSYYYPLTSAENAEILISILSLQRLLIDKCGKWWGRGQNSNFPKQTVECNYHTCDSTVRTTQSTMGCENTQWVLCTLTKNHKILTKVENKMEEKHWSGYTYV